MQKNKANTAAAITKKIAHSLLGAKQQVQNSRKLPKWLVKLATYFFSFCTFVFKIITLPIRNVYIRGAFFILLALFVVCLGYLIQDLPSPANLTNSNNFAVSTQIFDRNGVLLYEIFADEHRVPVKLADIPESLKEATIAIEDQRFYSHIGIDFFGVIRALINNMRGLPIEGGSTITQQLVKNALLTREKTFTRKAKEAILAIMTEIIYSKEEILEMYLNYVSYGGTAVGIEAAAQQYFNKSAKDLTLAESALLAGLPQAPSTYNPFGSNPDRYKARQAQVLDRMVADDYITSLEAEQAKGETLTFALKKTDIQAPHFVFFVRDLLYEKYGVEKVERGGLRVTTTLDLGIQEQAQASVSAEVEKLESRNVGNGAALVIKPHTGEILTMVGSRDYFDTARDGQVNVTIAERQPGSSIKPIMYATAFQEKLLNPGTVLIDAPTCFSVPNQKPYCPKNYDGSYRGLVTVRQSLGNSLNIPAVKGLKLIGLETFINQARRMGITSWQDPSRYGLSLTLGGGEVKMIDLAQAFGVIANQGIKVPITPILKVEDFRGEVLENFDTEELARDFDTLLETEEEEAGKLERVLDRAPAYLTAHIMQDNRARTGAFGPNSQLVIPDQVVSAKTGTTNDLKDNWTVGFTPEILVITWVGNNDGSPMNPYLVSGITGAAPIFHNIMVNLLANQEPLWQVKPADVTSAPVCASGMPATTSKEPCSPRGEQELFWIASQPSDSEVVTQDTWINPATGLPPKPGESIDGLVLENRTLIKDPVTPYYCANCARPVDDQGQTQYEQQTIQ